jgi:hypothetical protein
MTGKSQWVRPGQLRSGFCYEWTDCSSKEPAETAGAAVKKAYPIVMVTIVDTEDGTIEVIKA